MSHATLNATTTRGKGSRNARRLRLAGSIPAVVYGEAWSRCRSRWSQVVSHRRLRRAGHQLTDRTRRRRQEVPRHGRDIQRHPVRGTVAHVDFQVVDPNEPVVVEVPLHMIGDAVEVRHADWKSTSRCSPLKYAAAPTRSPPTLTSTSPISRSAARSASRSSRCPRASSPPATRLFRSCRLVPVAPRPP